MSSDTINKTLNNFYVGECFLNTAPTVVSSSTLHNLAHVKLSHQLMKIQPTSNKVIHTLKMTE